MAYKFSMVKIVCEGINKGCDHCREIPFTEGYCPQCSRPLWKQIGEKCNFVLGYYEPKDLTAPRKPRVKQGKIHLKCKFCNHIITME